jgi:hypothetical protein
MVFLFRKVQFLREVAGGMLGLSGRENQSSSKRALCRTQTNVEKWSFLKKFITTQEI